MRKYTRDLYARLEAETGQSTGFRPVGLHRGRRRPRTASRSTAASRRSTATAASTSRRSPRPRSRSSFPLAATDDLLAGFYVKDDGRVNPVDVTMSLAKGARQQGVRIVEGVSAGGIRSAEGRSPGSRPRPATSSARSSSTAPGCGRGSSAATHGVTIPQPGGRALLPASPSTIDGIDPDGPVLEDPAAYGYFREEGGGLMVGLFEPVCAPWKVDGDPGRLLVRRAAAGLGPHGAVTSSGRWTACRSPHEVGDPEVLLRPGELHARPDALSSASPRPPKNYFVCAGLNSMGILPAADSAGCWRTGSRPALPTSTSPASTSVAPSRTRPRARYRSARTTEILGMVYAVHSPGTQLASARGVRALPPPPRPGGAGRVLQGRQRLGEPRLLRLRNSCATRRIRRGGGAIGGGTGRPSTAPSATASASWTCRSWPTSSCRERMRAQCWTGCPRVPSTARSGSSPIPSGSTTRRGCWPTSR